MKIITEIRRSGKFYLLRIVFKRYPDGISDRNNETGVHRLRFVEYGAAVVGYRYDAFDSFALVEPLGFIENLSALIIRCQTRRAWAIDCVYDQSNFLETHFKGRKTDKKHILGILQQRMFAFRKYCWCVR